MLLYLLRFNTIKKKKKQFLKLLDMFFTRICDYILILLVIIILFCLFIMVNLEVILHNFQNRSKNLNIFIFY